MPPIDNSKIFKNYHQELFCINGLGVKIITVSCENYLSNFREFYLLNILVSLNITIKTRISIFTNEYKKKNRGKMLIRKKKQNENEHTEMTSSILRVKIDSWYGPGQVWWKTLVLCLILQGKANACRSR